MNEKLDDNEILTKLRKLQNMHSFSDRDIAYMIQITPSYISHIYSKTQPLTKMLRINFLAFIETFKDVSGDFLYRKADEKFVAFNKRKKQIMDEAKKLITIKKENA